MAKKKQGWTAEEYQEKLKELDDFDFTAGAYGTVEENLPAEENEGIFSSLGRMLNIESPTNNVMTRPIPQEPVQYPQQTSDIDNVIGQYNQAASQQRKPLINLPTSPVTPVEQGNIDLSSRPVVRNPDGSISTVRSMSVNMDGREVLIPTVSDDGRLLFENEAVDQYIKTGKHLGKFDTPEAATDYAKKLHDQQEQMYVQSPTTASDWDFESWAKQPQQPQKKATNDFIAGFGQAQSGYGTGMRYLANALNAPDFISNMAKTAASPVVAGVKALTKKKDVKPIPAPQPGSFTNWLESKGREWEQSGRETYEKYKSDDLTEKDREELGPVQSALVETWTDFKRNVPFTITNLPLNAIPYVGTPLASMAEASVEAGNRFDEDYQTYYDEGIRQGMSLKDADEYARGQAVNRADKVMVGNTALLSLTNKLEWGLFTRGAGPMAKKFGRTVEKQWNNLSPGARVSATLMANGLSESVLEELPQSNIQRYVTGEGMDWNPFSDENFREMRSAFAIGAASAGVGAAGRGVMDARRRSGVTRELQALSGGAADSVTQKQVEDAERELKNQLTANFDLARQGEKKIKQAKTEQAAQEGRDMVSLATANLSNMNAQYGIFNESGKINITNSTIARAGVDYGIFKITAQGQQQEQNEQQQEQGPSLSDDDFFRLATEFDANQAGQTVESQTAVPASIPQPQVVEFSDARQAEQFGQANPAWRRYTMGEVQYFQAPSPDATPAMPGGAPVAPIEVPAGSGITLEQARNQIPQSVEGMTNAQRFSIEKSMDNAARAGDYRAAADFARQLGGEQLARKYEEVGTEERITRALNDRNYQEAARLAQTMGNNERAQRFISLGEFISSMPRQQTPAKQGQTGEAKTNAASFREQRRMAQAYQNLSSDEQYFLDILRAHNVTLDAVRDEIAGEIDSRIQQEIRVLKQEASDGGVELIPKQDGEGKVRASTNPDWYRQLYPMNNQKYHDLAVNILRGSRRHWSVDETISDEFNALEATVNAIETTRENINRQVPEWVRSPVAGGTGGNRDIRGAAEQFSAFGRSSIEAEQARSEQSRKQKQVEEALRSESLRKKMDTSEGRAQIAKLPEHIRTALEERQRQEQEESQEQKAKTFLPQVEVDRQQEKQDLTAELVSQGMSEGQAQKAASSFIERRKAPRVLDETIGYQVKEQFTPTIKRAWDDFKANGRQFAFANVDFLNLGGLNNVAGNEEADKHLQAVTKIISDEVDAIADNAQYFRWGGDEWRILVPDTSKETLDTALKRAQTKIAEYAKSTGLDKLMHGKKTRLQTGIGIHYAADEFKGRPSYQEMISDSELAVLNKKNQLFAELEKRLEEQGGNNDVIRVKTESAGSGASGGQTRGTEQGNRSSEGNTRQKESGIHEKRGISQTTGKVNKKGSPIVQQADQQAVQQNEQQTEQQAEPRSDNAQFDRSQANRDRLINRVAELTGKKPKKKTFDFVDDSDAALERANKKLQSELSKISSNPVFNPMLMGAAFEVGAIHLQRGANNFSDWSAKMVDTVGEKIRPYLKSVWNSITAWPKDIKYNDQLANSLFEYAGILYEDGITTQVEMEQRIGEDMGEDIVPLVKSAFVGITEWPGFEGGKQNGKRGREDMERDNATVPNRDGMGTEVLLNGPAGDSRGDGRGSEEAGETGDRQQGNRRVSPGGAARSGSEGNQGVRSGTSVDQERTAGSQLAGGSSLSGDDGISSDPTATAGLAEIAADGAKAEASGTSVSSKLEAQKKAESIPVKVANPENIRKTLPFLMPEQQEDVLFAEERLSKPDGYGVLFTNGTGTGKTFTGIGIVKRFAKQGKKNILITAPNDKIIAGWIEAGQNMGLDITRLEDTKSAGKGIVITTYANMGQNQELVSRNWDLVVADESHYLSSGEQGDITGAGSVLRAITLHRKGYHQRFNDLEHDLIEEERVAHSLAKITPDRAEEYAERAKLEKKARDITEKVDRLRKERYEEWDNIPPEQRSRVVFLSATPFAYVKNIEYAEGYLFDYGEDTNKYRGYNEPDPRENFFVTHFGYRMRYNKLTTPDANVDNEVMEQQFHEWLKDQGVLSGRMLSVDKDYDRNFVLVNDAIGGKIDEGLDWLWEADDRRFQPLYDFINDQFTYHQKMYLLESIKAKHAVGLIKDYLKQGKKVVVFHDFNKGGGFHPFKPEFIPEDLRSLYHEFTVKRPDLLKLNLSELLSPIEQMKQSFGDDAMFFNGTIPKKVRGNNVDMFNADDSGKNLIVVQSDAGREGISLHDRTGKHQRVLINLGMPVKPTAAIQIEGRTYRVGQQSDAIFRYLNTGTTFERLAFATKIAERASTAENLALGKEARRLKAAFIESYEMSGEFPAGMDDEGKGGKEKDRANRREMTEFQRAKTYYFSQQKKTGQTKSAEGNDYYATPEPIGYKMVEWANMKPGERALEPSAGHGAIARFFPPHADHVMVEPSLQLGPRAVMVSPAKLISNQFEDYHIINKFSAVVMNPPYGHGGKTAIEHLGKAYKHLYDGGRIVAILPDGGMADKRLNAWYDSEEAASAYPVAEIKLPSVAFERAGTTVRTKIVVIEKHADAAGTEGIDTQQIDLSGAETIGELFDRIENISLPDRVPISARRTEVTTSAPEQSHEAASETAEQAQEDNYTKHEFRHTKNKNMIYIAKAKKYLRDNFDQHMNIAKRHDGWWNGWDEGDAVKGFAFNTATDREAFIKESSVALQEAKLSGDTVDIDNIESVDPTTDEQRIVDLAKGLGARVEIIDHADSSLRGFYMNGTLYLNRNGNLSLEWTLGHEFTHWLAENRPGVYKAMRSAIGKVTDAQVNAYRRRLGERGKAMEREAIVEEMIGDEVGNGFGGETLWEKIQKKSPALFRRIVQSVKEWLQSLTGKRSYRESGLTRRQVSEIESILPDVVRQSLEEGGYVFQSGGKSAASQEQYAAPFYSALTHAIEAIDFKAMPGKDLMNRINKTPGVKPDEIKWTGIAVWLDGKNKVTKDDVLDYLQADGAVKIDTITKKAGSAPWRVDLTGGYVERFATRAEAQRRIDEENEWIDEDSVNVNFDEDSKTITVSDYGGVILEIESDGEDGYRVSDGYWPNDENKFNDIDEAMTFANEKAEDARDALRDEVSSEPINDDSKGDAKYSDYTVPDGENYREVLLTLPQKTEKKYQSAHWKEENVIAHIRLTDREDADSNKVLFVEEFQSDWAQDARKKGIDAVPEAPFVSSTDKWLTLAVKQVTRIAAEGGYDKVAIARGEQNADHYNLRKQIGSMRYIAGPNIFTAYHDENFKRSAIHKSNVEKEDLPDIIGKELANRLLSTRKEHEYGKPYELSGVDLEVGGEGMKSFYDQIVPSAVTKFLKQFGVKTVTVDVGHGKQFGFPVTKELADSVLFNGQPLFSYGDDQSIDNQNHEDYNIAKELQRNFPEYKTDKEALKLAESGIRLSGISEEISRTAKVAKEETKRTEVLSSAVSGEARKPTGKTIGLGVTKSLIQKGVVPLTGHTIKNAKELAVLAQALRHPGYEVVSFIFTKGNDIVHHEAASAYLPNATRFRYENESSEQFIDRMNRTIKKVGADGYYVIHNHPSGDPIPSSQDRSFTKELAAHVLGMKAHVVINSKKYSTISPIGKVDINIALKMDKDSLLSPEISHPALGAKVDDTADIASILKHVQLNNDTSTVFYLSTKNIVRGVQEVDNRIFSKSPEVITRYLRWSTRAHFSYLPIVVTNSREVYDKIEPLVKSGVLDNAVDTSQLKFANNYAGSISDSVYDKQWMGQEITDVANRIMEDRNNRQLPDKLTIPKVAQKGENYKILIQALDERKWTREEKSDGTIVYHKPAVQEAPVQKTPVTGDRFTFQNEETQSRAEKAMGGIRGNQEPTSIKESLGNAWDLLKRKFGREYEHLPHTAEFSEIRFALQKLQQQKGVANDKVIRILDDITKNLSKDEYYHFSLKVLLDDLQHEEGSLPFGLTHETLKVEQERLNEHIVANYPNVTKAVEKRKEIWSDIKDKYIAAMKKIGFNVENKFAREDYYRHQVLAYMDQKRITGIGQKLKTPTNRGWLRRRDGSEKDINLNYMEAEFEVMRDMLYDMEVAKTIKLVDDQYNIIGQLKVQALAINDKNIMQMFRDMVSEFGLSGADGTVEEVARKMYRQNLNRKQAMAFARLSELASRDELPSGPNNKYQDVVESLAQEYFARKEASDENITESVADSIQSNRESHAKLMEYAAYLLKEQRGSEGSKAAAMLFRGVSDKKKFIKEALNKEFVTWKDLMPPEYDVWSPRTDTVFYKARTIPDEMVEKLMTSSLDALGVSPEQIKTALVRGGRREGYVVKKEIAATLDQMTPDFVNDTGNKWSQYVVTPWKIWQLTSPARIIKYNLRNMTGDLDAVLAGNPSSLRKVSQSMKDLNRYFYGDGEMSNELREWFERGGMQTLLQVQEIGDVNKLKLFIRFSEQKDGLENALKTGAAKVWDGYWGRARKITDLREALLRYANYLEYLEQLENNKGRPKNFGASMSEEVMALSDNRDKAFKLANELLGDYNAVSVAGKELRKHLIPFWSWTEINAKRYINLFRNCASNEGIAKTVGKRLLTKAAVYSPYLAVQVGEFAVKAAGMWIMLQMYNFAFWPDEEKELPPSIAGQPHIILGRDADGKVMYFNRLGAFADFLEWFGMDTPVKTVTDYLNGKKTIAEIAEDMVKNPVNKFVQGITPTIKTTGELLIGRRLFPDVFKPRRIHDYPEYIFDSFGLGDEYRWSADKPHPRYDAMKFILYKTEPDKAAYYNIMEEKNRFLKDLGKGGDGDFMSARSEAIRNYKMALRYGDKKIAAKYLLEYKTLGGTKQSLATALANMSPLAGLTREQRKKFLQGLSGEDKAELLKAERYYKEVLLGGFRSRKTSSGAEKVTVPWNVDLPNKKR